MPNVTQYLDFDLSLTREGNEYMAEVRDSPAGGTARVALRWPFGTEPHEMLLLKLENAILKGRGYRAGPLTSEEKVLREFGSEIFRAVFRDSEDVARKFTSSLDNIRSQQGLGLRLVLRVEPPELAMLPWEYMFEQSKAKDSDGNYLCLRDVSPLVRYLNVAGSRKNPPVDGTLRILGMIANPATDEWKWLDAEAERRRIAQALKIPRPEVELRWVPGGSIDDLFEMMQRETWHVFHFIGHGGTETYVDEAGQPHTEGFVVMQDRQGGAVKITASDLALMLDSNDELKLTVLNCCESGRSTGGFSSIGAALVTSSTPMAVAMQYAISDGSASCFAGAFYGSLIAGQCVERALTAARKRIKFESNVEWGIPVLFTRTTPSALIEIDVRRADASSEPPAAVPAMAAAPTQRVQALQELRRLFL